MWWKVTLMVVILMAVCFLLGLYVGGGVFLQITAGDYSGVSYRTLFDARHLALDDGWLVYLPWAWCITAALTFLPVGLTLLALLARSNRNAPCTVMRDSPMTKSFGHSNTRATTKSCNPAGIRSRFPKTHNRYRAIHGLVAPLCLGDKPSKHNGA